MNDITVTYTDNGVVLTVIVNGTPVWTETVTRDEHEDAYRTLNNLYFGN